jgi:hypothetical protein
MVKRPTFRSETNRIRVASKGVKRISAKNLSSAPFSHYGVTGSLGNSSSSKVDSSPMLNSSFLAPKSIDNELFLTSQPPNFHSPLHPSSIGQLTEASYPANLAPPWKKYPTAVGPNPVKSPLGPSEATIFLPADSSESRASAGSIWIRVLTTSIAGASV